MKKVFLTFMTAILLCSGVSSVSAQASDKKVDENSDFEETQEVLEKYITSTEDGEVVFDVNQAKEDGQSEFIIGSGEIINQLNQEYSQEEVTTMAIPLPIWGNWCGPGYGGGETQDLLDAACKQHDLDYAKYGYFDCDSDLRLTARIAVDRSKMGFIEKQYASAVAAYFVTQTKYNNCY